MKSKTPITAAELVKELRALASELARTSQSGMLDHSRVCADTAKNIRKWLRTVEVVETAPVKPVRVIVEIEGGLPSGIYSSDPKAEVSILSRDYSEDREMRAEQEAEDAPLEAEISTLTQLY